ncbi:MAG TPA: HAD family hydrolase [Verrucomicrobiae bacterium]|jgi:putative hydrolase of the HAD superfamily|nr:HAD family hydrolase [Verrucomicrobiae bacterium]
MAIKEFARRALSCKAVLLDLDNTLYEFAPCHAAALKKSHGLYAAKVRRISFSDFRRLYVRARAEVKKTTRGQAASHSRLLYFKRMLEETGAGRSTLALDLDRAYWKAYMDRMKIRPWVRPLLLRLRKKGTPIVIVTDMTAAWQLEKVKKLKLEGLVDFIVTSEEAGVEKPHAAIFKFALRKAGAKAGQAIMIGDDPRKDRTRLLDCYLV